jgi:hypothetical protein
VSKNDLDQGRLPFNERYMKRSLKVILNLLFVFVAINSTILPVKSQPGMVTTSQVSCHFGITVPKGTAGYDLSVLGVDSYLDWGTNRNSAIPAHIEHIKVLQVGDATYGIWAARLPGLLSTYPGSVWIIGNEPDAVYANQDIITAEVYADRYFDLATIIRNNKDKDPNAKIGFGTIIQPTPLRLRYLNRAWDRLVTRAGSEVDAKKLIDIYTIHAFILNEDDDPKNNWGAGIPKGFEFDHADAIKITEIADTHSSSIFQTRTIAFRQWMFDKGEKEKPLWITEYGSLLPPYNAPGNHYATVSDELTRDFMLSTFDFIINAADPVKGYSPDGNRLVQKSFWYSLNEDRTSYGGGLFDLNTKLRTIVGDAFVQYAPAMAPVSPDLYPSSIRVQPRHYSNQGATVDYGIEVRIGNNVVSDWMTQAVVTIYDGENPTPIGAVNTSTSRWPNIIPGVAHNLRVVVAPPTGVDDMEPSNNSGIFAITTGLPSLVYLPYLSR